MSEKKKTSTLTWIIAAVMFIGFIGAIADQDNTQQATASTTNSTNPAPKQLERSNVSYKQLDAEVGCLSKYNDDKKDDIFDSKYKGKVFQWRGKVAISGKGEASLDFDGGLQDISLKFADGQTGYDFLDGQVIEAAFIMQSRGGCFLPFSGTGAVLAK